MILKSSDKSATEKAALKRIRKGQKRLSDARSGGWKRIGKFPRG